MRGEKSSELTQEANQSPGCQPEADPVRGNPSKLRELAAWYREFAERAGNPSIWEARLRMAEELDAEADHIDDMARAEQRKRVTRRRNFGQVQAIRR